MNQRKMMNSVVIIGKLLDIKRAGNSYLYTIGVSDSSDLVEVYNKFDKSELKGSYVRVDGFISERSGRTAVLTNTIKKVIITFKDETF